MLIQNIKVSGLLSFGPKGIDLPMRKLNVLIGANGSGKSNFLEVINLFKVAPLPMKSISGPIMDAGGMEEWLWKGDWAPDDECLAQVEVVVSGPDDIDLRHAVLFGAENHSVWIAEERIETAKPRRGQKKVDPIYFKNVLGARFYDFVDQTNPQKGMRKVPASEIAANASILAQVRDPGRYKVFAYLEREYFRIQLYRDCSFGPHAPMRKAARSDERHDQLARDGDNLASVVAGMSGSLRKQAMLELQTLYPGIQGIHTRPVGNGKLQLYLEEANEVEIPASRLSDGTLRFLALLVILLNPKPASVTVIEEPELGLHPDVIPQVARLLKEASERTQLVVTTHSRALVDCLGDDPESVIVCEKHEGESVFERLDGERMKVWLDKYSLGELWSKGELGGNRW